jgi:hypothetical protein
MIDLRYMALGVDPAVRHIRSARVGGKQESSVNGLILGFVRDVRELGGGVFIQFGACHDEKLRGPVQLPEYLKSNRLECGLQLCVEALLDLAQVCWGISRCDARSVVGNV